jgi:hypothetical protein
LNVWTNGIRRSTCLLSEHALGSDTKKERTPGCAEVEVLGEFVFAVPNP